jgi:hypothetical protein
MTRNGRKKPLDEAGEKAAAFWPSVLFLTCWGYAAVKRRGEGAEKGRFATPVPREMTCLD